MRSILVNLFHLSALSRGFPWAIRAFCLIASFVASKCNSFLLFSKLLFVAPSESATLSPRVLASFRVYCLSSSPLARLSHIRAPWGVPSLTHHSAAFSSPAVLYFFFFYRAYSSLCESRLVEDMLACLFLSAFGRGGARPFSFAAHLLREKSIDGREVSPFGLFFRPRCL